VKKTQSNIHERDSPGKGFEWQQLQKMRQLLQESEKTAESRKQKINELEEQNRQLRTMLNYVLQVKL